MTLAAFDDRIKELEGHINTLSAVASKLDVRRGCISWEEEIERDFGVTQFGYHLSGAVDELRKCWASMIAARNAVEVNWPPTAE